MKISSNLSKILIATLVFFTLNISLYFFAAHFHRLFPFQADRYFIDSYHFLPDPGASQGKFNFLRSWGQYDAQWFLKIAQDGYPFRPPPPSPNTQPPSGGLTYAFFPLYPLLVKITDFFLSNVELSAFMASNLLLTASFFSLIYVVTRKFSLSVGLKSAFLIFTFPFSIFYRSYFSEGLFLLLIIWLTHFLLQKKFIPAAIFLGLANITRGSIFLFNVFFIYVLSTALRRKSISFRQALTSGLVAAFPLILWIFYNYYQTGDPFYFYHTLSSWFVSPIIFSPILYNTLFVIYFPQLPLHLFHKSKIDVVMAVLTLILLKISKKHLPWQMWSVAFFLWLTPLLSHDLMSFSRYSSVLFPLFVYLATVLGKKTYAVTIFLFTAGLFLTSLLFVNWYWIG